MCTLQWQVCNEEIHPRSSESMIAAPVMLALYICSRTFGFLYCTYVAQSGINLCGDLDTIAKPHWTPYSVDLLLWEPI